MTQLALWLLVCAATAWFLRRRPLVAVCVVILLWTAVPAVASRRLTGIALGPIGFHPATWLLLTVLAVQILVRPAPLAVALGRHALLLMVVTVFAAGALLTSRVEGSGGTRLLMDQIVGPAVLWLLVVAYADGDLRALRAVRNTVVVAMTGEAVLAVVQKSVGSVIFYEKDYLSFYWFKPDRFDRWFATSDSPLALSLCLCVAGALTLGLRRWLLRFSLLLLFVVATAITQSRTGTAVMCALVVYAIFRTRMVLWARALVTVGCLVAGYRIATSAFVSGLTTRLTNDNGSTGARVDALTYMADHWTSYVFSGFGLTSSYTIGYEAGLQTSLESSYLMYVVDVGALLATLYFGAQVALLLLNRRQRSLPGATLAAVAGLALQSTFSGIAGTSVIGTYVWTALALVVVSNRLNAVQPVEDGAPSAQERLAQTSWAPAARREATSLSSYRRST